MTKCACGTEIGIRGSLVSSRLGRLCPRCVLEGALEERRDEGSEASGLCGAALGGYDVLEVIGSGAMGTVYRARQRALDRFVALKVLSIPGHAEATERFLREARSLARLKHPHIVPVHDVGTDGGHSFYVMDLVEGGTLALEIARGPLEPRRAAGLLAKVARAVAHAHERGIIHRDLKPANILLGADGEPMVADFGLARDMLSSAALTRNEATIGTAPYMAPEQAAGRARDVDARTDTYALGAVLYETLAGKPPFGGDGLFEVLRRVQFEEPPPITKLRSDVPQDLVRICMIALAKNPAERYQRADELARDLDRFIAGEPTLRLAPQREARVRASGSGIGALAIAAVAMVALVAMVAFGLFAFFTVAGPLHVVPRERRAPPPPRMADSGPSPSGQTGPSAEPAEGPDTIRARIAALDLDGASKLLSQWKLENPGEEARRIAAGLAKEIDVGKKVVEPALRAILKLLDEGKPREAYRKAMAVADQHPGAIALAALRPRVAEARRLGFVVIDDFDELSAGGSPVLKWDTDRAAVEFVDDPMGGHALHWRCAPNSHKSRVFVRLPAAAPFPIRIGDFEMATIRVRAPRAMKGVFDLGLSNEGNNFGKVIFKIDASEKWQEVRIPFDRVQPVGLYDPEKVVTVNLYYTGNDAIDLTVDDVLLVPRAVTVR